MKFWIVINTSKLNYKAVFKVVGGFFVFCFFFRPRNLYSCGTQTIYFIILYQQEMIEYVKYKVLNIFAKIFFFSFGTVSPIYFPAVSSISISCFCYCPGIRVFVLIQCLWSSLSQSEQKLPCWQCVENASTHHVFFFCLFADFSFLINKLNVTLPALS